MTSEFLCNRALSCKFAGPFYYALNFHFYSTLLLLWLKSKFYVMERLWFLGFKSIKSAVCMIHPILVFFLCFHFHFSFLLSGFLWFCILPKNVSKEAAVYCMALYGKFNIIGPDTKLLNGCLPSIFSLGFFQQASHMLSLLFFPFSSDRWTSILVIWDSKFFTPSSIKEVGK